MKQLIAALTAERAKPFNPDDPHTNGFVAGLDTAIDIARRAAVETVMPQSDPRDIYGKSACEMECDKIIHVLAEKWKSDGWTPFESQVAGAIAQLKETYTALAHYTKLASDYRATIQAIMLAVGFDITTETGRDAAKQYGTNPSEIVTALYNRERERVSTLTLELVDKAKSMKDVMDQLKATTTNCASLSKANQELTSRVEYLDMQLVNLPQT